MMNFTSTPDFWHQTYGNLLKDTEVDVKIEAVKSLSDFIQIVSAEKTSYLLPHVSALGRDALAIVRGNTIVT